MNHPLSLNPLWSGLLGRLKSLKSVFKDDVFVSIPSGRGFWAGYFVVVCNDGNFPWVNPRLCRGTPTV